MMSVSKCTSSTSTMPLAFIYYFSVMWQHTLHTHTHYNLCSNNTVPYINLWLHLHQIYVWFSIFPSSLFPCFKHLARHMGLLDIVNIHKRSLVNVVPHDKICSSHPYKLINTQWHSCPWFHRLFTMSNPTKHKQHTHTLDIKCDWWLK